MAEADNRSQANWLAVMVDREYEKYKKESVKMIKLRIYWSEEDLQCFDDLSFIDIDIMNEVCKELVNQGINVGEWDDGDNLGVSWSVEVDKIPKKLSRQWDVIK